MAIEYVVIDGELFNVPVKSLERSADYLYKFAERTVDGHLHSELIGVYINYRLEFAPSLSVSDYAALWEKLTEPQEFHTITVPCEDGLYTYEAYFSNVKDQMRRRRGNVNYWQGLTVNFIARKPARV